MGDQDITRVLQEAVELEKTQKYEEAMKKYHEYLSENKEIEQMFSSFQARSYGKVLRKTGQASEAVAFFESFEKNKDMDQYVRNEFAWSLYDVHIKSSEKVSNSILSAATKIINICEQGKYSPYSKAVLQIMKLLITQPSGNFKQALEWADRLNIDLLNKEAYFWKAEDGTSKTVGSELERYYSMIVKCLYELEQYQSCCNQISEAFSVITDFHNDRDFWLRWYRAKTLHGLNRFDEAIEILNQLLLIKKDWFIYKEIAEILFQQQQFEQSLLYCASGALAFGEPDKKIHMYELMIKILLKIEEKEAAIRHAKLVCIIYRDSGRVIKPELISLIETAGDSLDEASSLASMIRELKPLWSDYIYPKENCKYGKVIKLIAEGRKGFICQDNGESFYFNVSSIVSDRNKIKEGVKVSFYLEPGFDRKKNIPVMNAVHIKVL
ncbi:MAG: repeat-containing protein [Firmicutes bacterium]|nr:repeat-containing protein [Bacillota bacterium]